MKAIRALFQSLRITVAKLVSPLLAKLPFLQKIGAVIPAGAKVKTWLWGFVAYTLALFVMLLLIKISFAGKSISEHAVAAGQKVLVRVSSATTPGKDTGAPQDNTQPDNNTDSPKPSLSTKQHISGVEGMNAVPLESLTEKGEKYILPIIGSDGTLPWKYYARPYAKQDKMPIVAIVFTNLGLSRPQTQKVITLPHEFTLAFSPYAGDTEKWDEKAHSEGFELMADLPMQAENYPLSDPGRVGLLEDLPPEQNIDRIYSVISRFPGYIGVLAPTDEKFTANKEEIKPYLLELKKRGMLFVYLKTAKNAALEEWIKANNVYALSADTVIDDDPSRNAVDAQLQNLVEQAKSRGYAIGIAHSYPSTIASLQLWMDSLKTQGVNLAPVSAVGSRVYP